MSSTTIDISKYYTTVAIIDADLISNRKHRHPNLVCMKLSSYYKNKGSKVTLKLNFNNLDAYDVVFIAKVFTDTPVPIDVLSKDNVIYNGTGFFFDKATPLPYVIEHTMPDYDLYNDWVKDQILRGVTPATLKDYTMCSIGFMTRGCIRHCPFCVNKGFNKSIPHSHVSEFLDPSRRLIMLWDDNFLACANWNVLLDELKETNKPFQFRQGLDIRLLTPEKLEVLSTAKLYGDLIFAFDNIQDKDVIIDKLNMLKDHPKFTKQLKFYVFCGFDRKNKWDAAFWERDIYDTFERIKILMSYQALPYIMRYKDYEKSPYRGIYINLARWCNQPSLFKKKSFVEWCELVGKGSMAYKYMQDYYMSHPDIADYFTMKFGDVKPLHLCGRYVK